MSTPKIVSVEQIAEVKLGRQRSPKNHDGPKMRQYLRAANVGWGGLLLDDVKTMNFTDAEMVQFRLEPGDILLNEASGSPREVGKSAIWGGEIDECAFQNTLLRVRLHDDAVDSRYLLHFFRREAETGAFVRGSRGTGINHLGRAALAKWEVPLLSIEEQRRIAAILDHADALRAKRREALARLDELTQSIFIDMFGAYLAGEQRCEVRPLSAAVQTGTIVTYGIVQAGEEYPGGVPYIRTGDISNGQIAANSLRRTDPALAAKYERSKVQRGDIVMSIRATVGTTAVVTDELHGANLTQGTARISPGDDVDGAYLLEFLRNEKTQHWISRQVKGATFREITLARLRELPVPLPPLELQRAFGIRVAKLAEVDSRNRVALTELDTLFSSLQSRAFRGEL
ncbi:restriction endonuclease subunit S [Nocardia camponoti]|uniref:Type I restriction modification DNA specificity domain-containing protein n=1 Tax=Nocardia camponoti TaxID=1616106 RepID=A0A917QB27_9NOCA|nr:restriction endonuclease subunit S [Nocardia camponoti]GGK40512.1 hypothetical protein GCM10011591_10160 [Nocardia camponoti]